MQSIDKHPVPTTSYLFSLHFLFMPFLLVPRQKMVWLWRATVKHTWSGWLEWFLWSWRCYYVMLLSLCSGRLADMGALSVCPAIFRGSCVWSELLPLAQVGRLFMGRRGLPTRPTSFSLSSCQSSFKPHGFTVKQIVIKLWVHRKAAALFPK